jgi:hypothetical protein
MARLFAILVVQFASFASILGLYLTLIPLSEQRPTWHWLLLGIAISAAFGLAWYEIFEFTNLAPKRYRSQNRINSFMCRWVSSGGRVVIFSRDMSWAHEDQIRTILLAKAERRELTVFLEHSIPLTDDLREHGATIVTYQSLGHIPRARFTIVDFGREGARVAVGVNENGRHVIQEYRNGYHPFFAVAEDLVNFLTAARPGTKHVS